MDDLDTFKSLMARARRDFDEIKARQLTGGDSIVSVLNVEPGEWDVDTTIPPTAASTWWEIAFLPEDGRLGFVQLGFKAQVTPETDYDSFTSYPSPLITDAAGLIYIVEYSNPNLDPVNVKLKFSMRSFRRGHLSWRIIRQS